MQKIKLIMSTQPQSAVIFEKSDKFSVRNNFSDSGNKLFSFVAELQRFSCTVNIQLAVVQFILALETGRDNRPLSV